MKLIEQVTRAREWSEEETLVLDQVHRIARDVIAPNAGPCDENCEFPWESVKAINDLGLNTLFIPEEFGGAPMSYRLYLEVVAIISEACASTGIIYATNFHAMKPLIDFGTQEQCARLLPVMAEGGLASLAITENNAGSDATGMTTRFTPDGDDIIVDGAKTFITNGDVADRILLFGKWSEIDDAKAAISVLVLEKDMPGFSVLGKERKMGHRASSTCALAFDGIRVPRSNLIGQPGDGLPILLASLNKSRPSVAAQALGITRAAFGDMVGYANERKQSGRKIIEFQGNQFTFADLACDLAMLEVWMDHVSALVDGGEKDFGLAASAFKMRASDLAMKMTTECVQVFGGYGYCSGQRAERLMRDAKLTQIWEGTNQIHRQLIGRSFIER